MTNQDEKSSGSNDGAPPPHEAEPDAPPVNVKRAPFAPPVRDPGVLALLNGLNPSVTPAPFLTTTTDGELSAKYNGAPREAPVALETPAPEPAVVVAPPPDKKKKKDPPNPATLESTFRNRQQPRSITVPVAVALLLVIGAIALYVLRGDPAPQASKPAVTPSPTAGTLPAAAQPAAQAPWQAAPAPEPETPPSASSSAKPAQIPVDPPAEPPTKGAGKRQDFDPGASPL